LIRDSHDSMRSKHLHRKNIRACYCRCRRPCSRDWRTNAPPRLQSARPIPSQSQCPCTFS